MKKHHSKLFYTGDIIRVKSSCRDLCGKLAGMIGIISNDSYDSYHPYLVKFLNPNPHNEVYYQRTRPFCPISLELVKRRELGGG